MWNVHFFRVLYWNPSEFSTGPFCSIVMFRDENSFVWGQEIKVRHLSYGANVSLEVFSHLGIFICFSFDWPLSKQSQVVSLMFLREAVMREKCSFFEHCSKGLWPPPLLFEHYVVNFSEGILTKVRKRLSQQLSTK